MLGRSSVGILSRRSEVDKRSRRAMPYLPGGEAKKGSGGDIERCGPVLPFLMV